MITGKPDAREIMAPTGMDQLSPPVDQVAPPPVEPYAPPAARRPAAWRTGLAARERRMWTAALAAALLVTVAGIGALYVDDTNNQATIRDLQSRNESLTGQTQNLSDQLKVTQGQLQVSRQQVTDLSNELQHPTLEVWNVPQTIHNSMEYLSSTVPDTFTLHLKLTSNGPMDVSILSTRNFSQAIMCVQQGGTTDYCMHHSGAAWGMLGVKNVNYDFTLAEGCAAYLAVITAPGPVTVTPDVSVTYNPAAAPTGACRS